MKALTVKQPWASLIVHGGKDVENRSWTTRYRGPIAIHAAARHVKGLEPLLWKAARRPTGKAPNSVVLGLVDLVDVVRGHPSAWAQDGCWHWVLANPRPLVTPIPQTGALGLWNVTPQLLDAIEKGPRR